VVSFKPSAEQARAEEPPGSHSSGVSGSLRRKALIGAAGAIIVVTVLTVFGDARALGRELKNFDWRLLPPILVLTLWNYALRFLKWEFFLRALGVSGLARWKSFRIFLAGFAMAVTPGKVGEFIKAVYVRRDTGAPANRVMAVITAERVTDASALGFLALIGATRYGYGREFVLVVFAAGIVLLLLLQRPHFFERPLSWADRFDRVAKASEHIHAFLYASSSLLRPRLLVPAVGLSVLSWAGECLAFYLVLIGLSISPSPELLMLATFILAVSSLAGGISLLPGGLGVADASMAGMLVLLVHDDAMTRSVAVAATLLIRFATLWFAVLIGGVAIASLERGRRARTIAAG
jgi:uncharacterized protein (TIRG00374 family)